MFEGFLPYWSCDQRHLALIGQTVLEGKIFEKCERDGRRTDVRQMPDHGYTISLPGEPPAQMS